MKKNNSADIESSLKGYFSIVASTASRKEALINIARKGVEQFGEYITPGSFNLSDEILISFVEILDQIIFELGENSDSGSDIRDYILDDLYSRISLTLEALVDSDKYQANLKNRPLYNEDLIIIRNKNLSDFVPLLISESEDITSLEHQITKTLLYFTERVHLDFFYNLFRNASSGYTKSAALLGLKYCHGRGLNWRTIKEIANGCMNNVEYAENFDTEEISSNRLPVTAEQMTFVLLHLEKACKSVNNISSMKWILSTFSIIPSLNFENSWLNEINSSISSILLQININMMCEAMKDETELIRAMNFIDFLPRNIFNRLTGQLDRMGAEFLFNLNLVVEKRKKSMDAYNSNILTYLSWNTVESF